MLSGVIDDGTLIRVAANPHRGDEHLAAPRWLEAEDEIEPARGRYRRCYAFDGAPGTVLIQQVHTAVQFFGAGEPLVAFRCTYGEYFRLDDEGRLYDRHSFDVRHHGWTRGAIARLLRRHANRGARTETFGPYVLTVRKSFVLGRGEIDGALSLRRMGRGEFGLLKDGPLQPACAELLIAHAQEREPIAVPGVKPLGNRRQGNGRGWFTDERRWSLEESFEHHFGARRGTFSDGGGYRMDERAER